MMGQAQNQVHNFRLLLLESQLDSWAQSIAVIDKTLLSHQLVSLDTNEYFILLDSLPFQEDWDSIVMVGRSYSGPKIQHEEFSCWDNTELIRSIELELGADASNAYNILKQDKVQDCAMQILASNDKWSRVILRFSHLIQVENGINIKCFLEFYK